MKERLPATGEMTKMHPSDETLRCEYQEICQSHLAITDFRGKLLGLLPLAAGAGIFLVLNKPVEPIILVAIGLFGAAVTIGLFFYEFRGMKECQLLRTRGAKLELALGLTEECSQFRGDIPDFVGPPGAGSIVYFAVVAGWLFVSVFGFGVSNAGLEKFLGVLLIAVYLVAVTVAYIIFNRGAKRA